MNVVEQIKKAFSSFLHMVHEDDQIVQTLPFKNGGTLCIERKHIQNFIY